MADAFVRAYLSLPSEIPSFQYWLFRVIKNLWLDHLRRHRATEPLPETLPDPATPESEFWKNERRRALWRAIGQLSPVDREIVTLHYFSGLPLHEVARLLGKSYGAVRQRLSRLRQTLKQRLEEQGYDIY